GPPAPSGATGPPRSRSSSRSPPSPAAWFLREASSMERWEGPEWSIGSSACRSPAWSGGSTLRIARPAVEMERAMTRRRTIEREPASKADDIRIVVADHHAIDRGGLVGLIERERGLSVVGEAASLDEALLQSQALAPDVLVLTLTLPDQTRTPAIPLLLEKLPQLRIL